jgi:PAS domain S-box-containing protein
LIHIAKKDTFMKNARILVVEDDPMVSKLLEVMLGHFGFDVTGVVSSGEAAIEATVASVPDLVLMDVNLEGELDGIQAATYIYGVFSVPVVFLTGSVDDETINRAKTAEPFGFQPKPFTSGELCATIEAALAAYHANKSPEGLIDWDPTCMMRGPDGIVMTDTQNNVLFLNPCAEQLTEWSRDQAMFKPLTDIIVVNDGPEAGPVDSEMLSAICEGCAEVIDRQLTLVSRSGKEREVTVDVRPVRTQAGRIVSMLMRVKPRMTGSSAPLSS